MMHEGRFYCGVHDPVKRQAKRDAKFLALDVASDAKNHNNIRAEAIRLARDAVVTAARNGVFGSPAWHLRIAEAIVALDAAEVAP